MQNTDKQRIIHLIGVPDIEGDQVHRIVHRKNALICLFLPCIKNKKEGVSKCTPSLFYVQSPDFHKLGLCYYLKILYL